jgi:hypothetical protein
VPRPQDRARAKYCPDCRVEAKKWRDWLRRQSAEGRKAKRVENERFREHHPDYFRAYRTHNAEHVRAIEQESKRRSRARQPDVHKVRPMVSVPCNRPGCFEVFSAVAASANVRRYCGEACRDAMRRFANLLAQLRHRTTPWGNYQRKRARLKRELRRRNARGAFLPPLGSSNLEPPSIPLRREARNRDPPRVVAEGDAMPWTNIGEERMAEACV